MKIRKTVSPASGPLYDLLAIRGRIRGRSGRAYGL